MGILWLKQVGTADQSPWDSSGINFTIPYYSMSLALNILVTLLIVARLMLYRRRVRSALGSTHGMHYTSLAAMVVESAGIYSAYSLLFLVPFAMNHPLAQLFLQGLSPVQVRLAPSTSFFCQERDETALACLRSSPSRDSGR